MLMEDLKGLPLSRLAALKDRQDPLLAKDLRKARSGPRQRFLSLAKRLQLRLIPSSSSASTLAPLATR